VNQHDRNKRRAVIVRRWAAYRTARAQREIWRKRREAQADDGEEVIGDSDLMAELPDGLVG
jgi:hypothetical protein